MGKKEASVIGIVLGIAIIIVGFFVQFISIDTSASAIGRDIMFGADFYTEIYDVTRDVGVAVNSAKTTIAEAIESVCDAIGWLIIAIGVSDIAYFVCKMASADECGAEVVYVETPPTSTATSTYTAAQRETAYNPASPRISTPPLPDGWTCTCGRNHAAYEASCICGVTKTEAKMKNQNS